MKYELKAEVMTNGDIRMEQYLVDEISKSSERISLEIIRTKNELIRKSLIKLGWTPPGEEIPKKKHVNQCEKCNGEGWLWGYELEEYSPPENFNGIDDTQYSCDACQGEKDNVS